MLLILVCGVLRGMRALGLARRHVQQDLRQREEAAEISTYSHSLVICMYAVQLLKQYVKELVDCRYCD